MRFGKVSSSERRGGILWVTVWRSSKRGMAGCMKGNSSIREGGWMGRVGIRVRIRRWANREGEDRRRRKIRGGFAGHLAGRGHSSAVPLQDPGRCVNPLHDEPEL